MPGRRPAAILALLLASLALAACVEPDAPAAGPDPTPTRGGRTSRGGPDADDGRNETLIGTDQGSNAGPGRFPFMVTAPPGGASDVWWRVQAVPMVAIAIDGVDGPGCSSTGWSTSFTESGVAGPCDDLAEGQHEMAVVLNEPVLEYTVEVFGLVADANATAPTET